MFLFQVGFFAKALYNFLKIVFVSTSFINFPRWSCKFSLWIGLGLIIFLGVGCQKREKSNWVERTVVLQGNNQCVAPHSACLQEIKVEFLGPVEAGLLGGKGTARPVGGVRPIIEVEKDLKVELLDTISDAGGRVRMKVWTGATLGDQYITVYPENNPKAKARIRIINGVTISGNFQEGFCGQPLSQPLEVTIYQSDGSPLANIPVSFRLMSSPEGKKVKTRFKPSFSVTDEQGKAKSEITLGETTGIYQVLVEIHSERFSVLGIPVIFYGKNLWGISGVFVVVLCGLAIFIYGIHLMSEGLLLVAGDNMRTVLRIFTSNRIVALLAGTVVTGVIQSSSACTVMVVGFVNAGLMNLEQAIGVIFGANIGTTVTAQIISFNISHFAPLSIILGIFLFLVSRNKTWQAWGESIFGFGLLFFGLEIMSDQLKGIAEFPSIIRFFQLFDCTPLPGSSFMPLKQVLGAICIGTFMTIIIQSSSATIGIAIALASNGLINFYTAVPLVLGDNIGTTITAILASLGTNKQARQAACAHVLFNVIGTLYMTILFYCPWQPNGVAPFLAFIDFVTPGAVFSSEMENITRHIAMAHTCFNLFNAILFLPFLPLMAKICRWVIPIKESEAVQFRYLDPHLLETPVIALEQTIRSLRHMTKFAWKMVCQAYEDVFMKESYNKALVSELEQKEEYVDRLQAELTQFLVQLTRHRLTENQSSLIPILMHCINDAEKVADRTDNILRLAKRYEESHQYFSQDAWKELGEIWSELKQLATHVINGLESSDNKHVELALVEEDKVNQLRRRFEDLHIQRLSTGECHPLSGVIFIELLAELEKVGDHLTNIADRLPELQKCHIDLKNE